MLKIDSHRIEIPVRKWRKVKEDALKAMEHEAAYDMFNVPKPSQASLLVIKAAIDREMYDALDRPIFKDMASWLARLRTDTGIEEWRVQTAWSPEDVTSLIELLESLCVLMRPKA